jgi:competence protein ComEC
MRPPRLPIFACAAVAAVGSGLQGFGAATAIAGVVLVCAALPRPMRRVAIVVVAGVVAGTAATAFAAPFPLPPDVPHAMSTTGTVIDAVARPNGRTSFLIEPTDGLRVRGTVREPLAVGSCARLHGRLTPFDEPRNPGEPSLRAIEAEARVVGTLEHARVVADAPCPGSDVGAWMPRLRAAASRVVDSALPAVPAAILAGALYGERGALPPALMQAFQDTGTVHVLVTAGLHLGVVAALATWLFARLGVARTGAACATIGIVWTYAFATGGHLPSLRAATMLSFALVAHALGRRSLSWNAFFAAMLVVALAWPAAVRSVSFALSFSCVAAILIFARPIARRLECMRVPEILREPIALTVATQLGVWPLTAAVFLVVSPYAVLANLIVVPGIALAMVLGFATLATQPAPDVASACAAVAALVLDAVATVVRAVASLPGAHVAVAPPQAWAIVVYDAACVLAAWLLRSERVAAAAGAIAVASCLVLASAHRYDSELRITMLDVGQGDGILIRTPHGHALMIDTGGALERGTTEDGGSPAEAVGERIVVPSVLRAGVTHLDGIILTHPHGDHVGGCFPLLRTIGADWIADSGQSYSGRAFAHCMTFARARGIPIHEPHCGDVVRTDDRITLRFLAPCAPYFTDGKNDVNENSIVVMLEYRTFRMLFMGDAGAQSEARLLASGVDLHADVLKVGHHGSAYSSTDAFVVAVHPRLAMISVGRHNTFGHPASTTLATLRRHGVRIVRTDICGAITIAADDADPSTMLPCDANRSVRSQRSVAMQPRANRSSR